MQSTRNKLTDFLAKTKKEGESKENMEEGESKENMDIDHL